MHQWPWYPGSGAADDRGPHGSVWNVPMAPGLPPARYLEALLAAVDASTDGWTPDILLVSSGFDSMTGDPLGGFTLELDDIGELTRQLVRRAERWCGGRVVSALEGGYEPDRVGAGVIAHLEALR
jgi:acetoin utilization deacetylase AcuC-like enzyme